MPSRAETVAVADDVWEEVLKYMVFAVSHSPEQSFVGFLGKLLSSGVSGAMMNCYTVFTFLYHVTTRSSAMAERPRVARYFFD